MSPSNKKEEPAVIESIAVIFFYFYLFVYISYDSSYKSQLNTFPVENPKNT